MSAERWEPLTAEEHRRAVDEIGPGLDFWPHRSELGVVITLAISIALSLWLIAKGLTL